MPRKKASHEDEDALSFEEHEEKEEPVVQPAAVTPGTLVKYFMKPGADPLAGFVASVNGDKVNLMVLEPSGAAQNATDVPFISGKAAPYPDLHFCTLP